jgi:DNA-binding CsgD family transcriptional regulator
MENGLGLPGRGNGLRGRARECALLDDLLGAIRRGESRSLILVGEAGIGKTALLDYLVTSASDLTVVRATGVESEMELPFAALHQLCAPMLESLERLPPAQRDALQTTFGLQEGAVPDRFFVGLAVLSLLSEVAADRPLVCVIDDAQWLDRASAQTLAFVSRRLLVESVVMVFAARESDAEFQGLRQLVVTGLRETDARQLLRSGIPGRIEDRVADRVLAEAQGNPLALLELPRALRAAQLAGGFGLPTLPSLQTRLETGFLERLEALPQDTRLLLLIAAAEPVGDPALLRRAAERLGITGSSVNPAESAGLIEIDSDVRFRHPLVRSAVYGSATPEERRQVHGALAAATDAQADPDRRAWHLAEATPDADENVAAELERAAERAQARGGRAAAAAFLERAGALTTEPLRRAERALAAAQAKYEAGSFTDAVRLLDMAEGDSGDLLSGRVGLLRAQIAFALKRGGDSPSLLLKAARELESLDGDLARATYLEALLAARFAGRLAEGVDLVEVSEAALAGPPLPQPPRPPDLLLHGLALRVTAGPAAAAPWLKEALVAFTREAPLPPEDARWLFLASYVASDLWDDESVTLLSTRELERCRNAGALSALPLALHSRGWVHVVSGELASAATLLDEMRAITDAIGIADVGFASLYFAAFRGNEAEYLRLSETAVGEAITRGEGFTLAIEEFVSGVLYNGLGRYDAVLAARGRPGDGLDVSRSPRGALPEVIEAAVRMQELPLAREALERLATQTRASGTEWALGLEARARALLAEGDAAERLYREAIDRLERTRIRVDLARAHLLYGEWLRRERRQADAREQLRIALAMFRDMGTEAFGERARGELQATGATVRRRSVKARGDLTAQERQIAVLARDGLSNANIGARLFLSPKTVAWHLDHVFAKLGIHSSRELSSALPSFDSALVSAGAQEVRADVASPSRKRPSD